MYVCTCTSSLELELLAASKLQSKNLCAVDVRSNGLLCCTLCAVDVCSDGFLCCTLRSLDTAASCPGTWRSIVLCFTIITKVYHPKNVQ